MSEPAFSNCPHCMYAFRASDPRFAVPPGERARVLNCPACGGMIRVHPPGGAPAPGISKGCLITVVVAIILLVLILRNS